MENMVSYSCHFEVDLCRTKLEAMYGFCYYGEYARRPLQAHEAVRCVSADQCGLLPRASPKQGPKNVPRVGCQNVSANSWWTPGGSKGRAPKACLN
jgi:hypothetical protein